MFVGKDKSGVILLTDVKILRWN